MFLYHVAGYIGSLGESMNKNLATYVEKLTHGAPRKGYFCDTLEIYIEAYLAEHVVLVEVLVRLLRH